MWQISITHVSQSKHPNIKIKGFRLFQNNNKKIIIIKNWDTWQHIICFHCLLKKLHLNCKR